MKTEKNSISFHCLQMIKRKPRASCLKLQFFAFCHLIKVAKQHSSDFASKKESFANKRTVLSQWKNDSFNDNRTNHYNPQNLFAKYHTLHEKIFKCSNIPQLIFILNNHFQVMKQKEKHSNVATIVIQTNTTATNNNNNNSFNNAGAMNIALITSIMRKCIEFEKQIPISSNTYNRNKDKIEQKHDPDAKFREISNFITILFNYSQNTNQIGPEIFTTLLFALSNTHHICKYLIYYMDNCFDKNVALFNGQKEKFECNVISDNINLENVSHYDKFAIYDTSMNLVNKMVHIYQIEPVASIYTTLIAMCTKLGLFDKGINIWNDIYNKDSNNFATRKDMNDKCNNINDCNNTKNSEKIGIETWNAIINLYVKNDKIDYGFELLNRMSNETHFKPTDVTFSTLISGICRELTQLCKTGTKPGEEARQEKIVFVDETGYLKQDQEMKRIKNIKKRMVLVDEILIKSIVVLNKMPNISIWTNYINAYAIIADVATCIDILKFLINPQQELELELALGDENSRECNILINKILRHRKDDDNGDILQLVKNKVPTTTTTTSNGSSCAFTLQATVFNNVLKCIKRYNYNICKFGYGTEPINNINNNNVDLDDDDCDCDCSFDSTNNINLKANINDDGSQLVEWIVSEMTRLGIKKQNITYSLLMSLTGFKRPPDLKECLKLYNQMKKDVDIVNLGNDMLFQIMTGNAIIYFEYKNSSKKKQLVFVNWLNNELVNVWKLKPSVYLQNQIRLLTRENQL